MIPRHVETLYCDDIRHEVGGKVSFIGCYSSALLLSKFPVTLAKLCVHVKVVTPASRPLRSLALRIFMDDATLAEVNPDDMRVAESVIDLKKAGEPQDPESVHMVLFNIALSPIRFDAPCIMKVRVQTEDEELEGINLKVSQASQGDSPSGAQGSKAHIASVIN